LSVTRQVITSLQRDGTDILGTKSLAVKIADESIVSGSLLTVESNHFCVLKSRGAVLNIYETGQCALTTPDKPLLGSAQGFFGGSSPWVFEVIYINRSKLLVRSEGVGARGPRENTLKHADLYFENHPILLVCMQSGLIANHFASDEDPVQSTHGKPETRG
jgi:hypothetical protein